MSYALVYVESSLKSAARSGVLMIGTSAFDMPDSPRQYFAGGRSVFKSCTPDGGELKLLS